MIPDFRRETVEESFVIRAIPLIRLIRSLNKLELLEAKLLVETFFGLIGKNYIGKDADFTKFSNFMQKYLEGTFAIKNNKVVTTRELVDSDLLN
jgi:hypothetical protein